MGPEVGTERYKRQVETVYTQVNGYLNAQPVKKVSHLDEYLMLFILDESYSRAAICEADKRLRLEHFG